MLALLEDEPAGREVLSQVEAGGAGISWVNLGEVYYIAARRRGHGRAGDAIRAVRGRIAAEEPDESLVLEAARIKADHRLSYADAFAVATAERHRAPLLTADPEILAAARPGLTIFDLRE